MPQYSSEPYLDLFQRSPLEFQSREEQIEQLRREEGLRYRVKTIRAGKMLECEIFPLWTSRQTAARARKEKESRKAQQNINDRNTRKKIMRLVNHNFTDADLWGTFGYDDANAPATPEQAKRDITNFIRKIKYIRKKRGLSPLRYLYVTEWKQEADSRGKAIRAHHHIVLSGDMERDEIEGLWKKGAYPQTRRLRVTEDGGLNGLACYLTKGSRGEKRWSHSNNLVMPVATVADRKITPRMAEKIALQENTAPELFETLYKGYRFKQIEINWSELVAGVYIYVQMYQNPKHRKPSKKEGKHQWRE